MPNSLRPPTSGWQLRSSTGGHGGATGPSGSRQDRVTGDRAHRAEARRLAEYFGEAHEAVARRDLTGFGRHRERIDVGDLVEAQPVRRTLGQRDALPVPSCSVMNTAVGNTTMRERRMPYAEATRRSDSSMRAVCSPQAICACASRNMNSSTTDVSVSVISLACTRCVSLSRCNARTTRVLLVPLFIRAGEPRRRRRSLTRPTLIEVDNRLPVHDHAR